MTYYCDYLGYGSDVEEVDGLRFLLLGVVHLWIIQVPVLAAPASAVPSRPSHPVSTFPVVPTPTYLVIGDLVWVLGVGNLHDIVQML